MGHRPIALTWSHSHPLHSPHIHFTPLRPISCSSGPFRTFHRHAHCQLYRHTQFTPLTPTSLLSRPFHASQDHLFPFIVTPNARPSRPMPALHRHNPMHDLHAQPLHHRPPTGCLESFMSSQSIPSHRSQPPPPAPSTGPTTSGRSRSPHH